MTSYRTGFAALITLPVLAAATAASAQTATQTAAPGPHDPQARAYVSAPIAAPAAYTPAPHGGHCGVFETCASTKIGLGKGDFMIRLSAMGILPQDRDSRVWVNGARMYGTHTSTTNQAMPEFTFEYFITDHIAADLIVTSTRHEVSANGGMLAGVAGQHKTDLGKAWVLPPALTFTWHFRPHKRFNPYVGVGVDFQWFYNMKGSGALGLTKLNAGFTAGPLVNVGFDYQVVGNWFVNADVKQIFSRMHAWAQNDSETLRGRVHESLDPTVVSAGIAYRF
ncbi:OmpW family protein [Acetobacter sp. AN02]|uniref:OmpW/AlkL family protein n=1 Tax=Acetobacter sp. AN02 TaxID=2894186 RepID=UPI002434347E|nr:OmpW family outer membrane protein [Acetobacter sp. AN02]MDG6094925.1 OmpW family protein [Acetobacter sp. AN02]